ncbi:isoamyl alcohol oxidase [Ceratobasidium sp. AG-Ba]|nr:isoamyl alcohol oxidase [Ceratobasidium sp. AG-Ba]
MAFEDLPTASQMETMASKIPQPHFMTYKSNIPSFVDKLPPEILLSVFLIIAAISPCTPKTEQRDTLWDIPLVCARWRRVSKEVAVLWSHIDVNFESESTLHTSIKRNSHYLAHLPENIPLYLHITSGAEVPIKTIEAAYRSLGAHMRRVCSLVAHGFAPSFLDLGLSECTAPLWKSGVLVELILHGPRLTRDAHIPTLESWWGVTRLKGLQKLELHDFEGGFSPHVEVALLLLYESPTLHTLCLVRVAFHSYGHKTRARVRLPNLRVLKIIHHWDDDGLPLILSRLLIDSQELNVELRTGFEDSPIMKSFRRLLKRSNVVCLSLQLSKPVNFKWYSQYLSRVPHLRTLRLDFDFSCATFYGLEGVLKKYSKLHLPHLETIYLVHGGMEIWSLKLAAKLVLCLKAPNLVFRSCWFPGVFEPLNENYINAPHADPRYKSMPDGMKEWLDEQFEDPVAI